MAYMFYTEIGITLDSDGNDTENMQILDVIYGHDSYKSAVNEFRNNQDINESDEEIIFVREVSDNVFRIAEFDYK